MASTGHFYSFYLISFKWIEAKKKYVSKWFLFAFLKLAHQKLVDNAWKRSNFSIVEYPLLSTFWTMNMHFAFKWSFNGKKSLTTLYKVSVKMTKVNRTPEYYCFTKKLPVSPGQMHSPWFAESGILSPMHSEIKFNQYENSMQIFSMNPYLSHNNLFGARHPRVQHGL